MYWQFYPLMSDEWSFLAIFSMLLSQGQTVLVENPMSVDASGKLVKLLRSFTFDSFWNLMDKIFFFLLATLIFTNKNSNCYRWAMLWLVLQQKRNNSNRFIMSDVEKYRIWAFLKWLAHKDRYSLCIWCCILHWLSWSQEPMLLYMVLDLPFMDVSCMYVSIMYVYWDVCEEGINFSCCDC